ncbi:MAG: hypothetical protein RBU25_00605 [Lentisphaeria bacterium]|jgi:hypothetical protein|nr:hypothetical protein [Lentisphaeria bacterium]
MEKACLSALALLLLTGCSLQSVFDRRFRDDYVPKKSATYIINHELSVVLPRGREDVSRESVSTETATGKMTIRYDDSDVYRSAIHMEYLGFPLGPSITSEIAVRKIRESKELGRPFAEGMRVSCREDLGDGSRASADRYCWVKLPENQFYYEISLRTKAPFHPFKGDEGVRRIELDNAVFKEIVESVRVKRGWDFVKPSSVP